MEYVALFRGINIGGKNIVKMADLKSMLSQQGFMNVRTYIQSGNALFSTDNPPSATKACISEGFHTAFGFESALTLRTKDELAAIIEDLPFTAQEIAAAEAAQPDVEHVYVFLLDDVPDPVAVGALCSAYAGADQLRAGKRELYLLCHQSIRDSKLSSSLSKLNVPMTARNWKTINKLYDMMGQ